MEFKKVPFYYYQNTTQCDTGTFHIAIDDNFYDKYKDYTVEAPYSYEWSGSYLKGKKVNTIINEQLNSAVVNSKYEFNMSVQTGEHYDTADRSWFTDIVDLLGIQISYKSGFTRTAPDQPIVGHSAKFLNGCVPDRDGLGYFEYTEQSGVVGYQIVHRVTCGEPFGFTELFIDDIYKYGYFRFNIFQSDLFTSTGAIDTEHLYGILVDVEFAYDNDRKNLTRVEITVFKSGNASYFINECTPPFTLADAQSSNEDGDNPFPDDNNPDGGDGDYTDPRDTDPTPVPGLPNIATTNFVTVYNPSNSDLNSLASFLWSNLFDVDTFKKVYGNPMDTIISLAVLPCVPASTGIKNIKFGNVDSGVSSSFCDTQFAEVKCGGIKIKKIVGGFTDYTPYVKISLFLPYIGFVHLDTDDIMGGTISVTYHVDCISGDLVAFVSHNTKGVLYSYNGNCLCNIPITQGNYAGALKNYYQQIAGVIPATVQGAASGGAAGAAMGAFSSAYNAGVNISLNTKPTYQRSGCMSGAAGIMGVQKPFIVIERPNISVPSNLGHYAGQMCNKTMSLGACRGLTICEAVHLDGIPKATSEELTEIETLLKNGVIL